MSLMKTDAFSYVFGGKFTSQGAWIHPRGNYETWELIYMIGGCAYLYEGERRIVARAGDCVLFSAGREHGGYRYSGEGTDTPETVSFFWIHASLKANGVPDAFARLPLHTKGMENTQIPYLCRQILHISSLHTYPKAMSDALLGMMFTEYAIAADAGSERGTQEDRLTNDIAEYIRINANIPLTAAAVAKHFGYHEDYLARLFRRVQGVGIKTYIDEMRMTHIRSLLLSTDAPLKSIAAQSGFDDYKAFLKYFVYHENMSPTALRERFYRTHTNNH